MLTEAKVITVRRIGDFYEAEDGAAQALHNACGCCITHRPGHVLAGFPYLYLRQYMERAESNGFVIAVA